MRYDDITAALNRANAEEWVALPEALIGESIETTLALREDLTVTLVIFDDDSVDNFDEPWVPAYHANQPRARLELRDHGVVVVRDYVVILDGNRWCSPLPRRGGENSWNLPAKDDRLGRMLNELIFSSDTYGWDGRIAEVKSRVESAGGTYTVG